MQVNSINTMNFRGSVNINSLQKAVNVPYIEQFKPKLVQAMKEIGDKTSKNSKFTLNNIDYVWTDRNIGQAKRGLSDGFSRKNFLLVTMTDNKKGKTFKYPFCVSRFMSGIKSKIAHEFEDCKVEEQLSDFANKVISESKNRKTKNAYEWANEICKNFLTNNK